MIERREITVEKHDIFHSVAQRIYENEIDMLVGAVEMADEKHEVVIPKSDNAFRIMPHGLEERLFEVFGRYKAEHREGIQLFPTE